MLKENNSDTKYLPPLSSATGSEAVRGFDRSGVSVEYPFISKFHFHGNFWKNLINLEYRIYPKYSHPCSFPYTSLQQVHFTAFECM